jgi:hypothetical protein
MFSFLPFGPAVFTTARLLFHAGLIAGFVVFRPSVERARQLRQQGRQAEAALLLIPTC